MYKKNTNKENVLKTAVAALSMAKKQCSRPKATRSVWCGRRVSDGIITGRDTIDESRPRSCPSMLANLQMGLVIGDVAAGKHAPQQGPQKLELRL